MLLLYQHDSGGAREFKVPEVLLRCPDVDVAKHRSSSDEFLSLILRTD